MRTQRRVRQWKAVLVLVALLQLKIAVDQLRVPGFGRPGWLIPSALAGLLFALAARGPVWLPYRVSRALLLATLPALLILNSMLAYAGYHVMPTSMHFGPVFGWTLYSEGMMALAILLGVACSSGFDRKESPSEDGDGT